MKTRTISDRLRNLGVSETVSLTNTITRLKAEGRDIISFSIGDPDFPTPKHIADATKKAIDDGFTKYMPSKGYLDLRNAIAEKSDMENEIECTADNVLVTPAKYAIFLACLGLVNPGDEVIVFEPCWVSFKPCIEIAEGKPVVVRTSKNDFSPNIEDLKEKITRKTRAIIINSPCNPTGQVLERETLEGISTIAEDNDLWVISDEIYEKIIFDCQHISIASIGNMRERTITVNGFSKAFSMTGWRLGWLLGPTDIVDDIDRIQQHSITCAPSFAQIGGLAALKGGQDSIVAMVEEFKRRRDFMTERLNSMKGLKCNKPKGAFYMFPRFEFDMSSNEFAQILLERANVAVTPGSAFGKAGEGHIRLSFSLGNDHAKTGLERIEEVLEKL
jgi:aspartate aminotransferase